MQITLQRLLPIVACAAVAAPATPADAHHSIAGVYDGRRQVTIWAIVREFRFVNPHPLITVEVVEVVEVSRAAGDGEGAGAVAPGGSREGAVEPGADDADAAAGARTWTLEMDNRWELRELGFDDDTLQPGDRIVVTGSLARRQARSLYVRRLEHPDEAFRYEHHR